MRTTLAIDDALLEKTMGLTGLKEPSALLQEALRALIERQTVRLLARLGASDPKLR